MRKTIAFLALPLLLAGCKQCTPDSPGPPTVVETIRDWFDAGNVLFALYERADYLGNSILEGAMVGRGFVKWDYLTIQQRINAVGSFVLFSTKPVAVVLYNGGNFDGNMAVYHCAPGTLLEVSRVDIQNCVIGGPTSIPANSFVITGEEYYQTYSGGGLQDPIMQHAGVNLESLPATLAAAFEEEFTSAEDVESAESQHSCAMWTDELNMYAFFDQQAYSYPNAASLRSSQVLRITEVLNIDPDWWAWDYLVHTEFFVKPTIQGPNAQLVFDKGLNYLWVESGTIHNRIYDSILAKMDEIHGRICSSLYDGIKKGIEDAVEGDEVMKELASAMILTNNQYIGWTFATPIPSAWELCKIGCRNNYACVPPMLILHKE